MFDVWASTVNLGQPCLYKRLNHHLVGKDGLVRNEVLAGIDRIMCENLLNLFQTFEPPTDFQHIPAEQRFLNVSALQKSIRRGDAAGAMRFAQQGCQLDQEHIFRRLAVCAVEDVGLGNLAAVGMALAVMGNKHLRNHGPRGSFAAMIARELALSPKSRLACDLLSIVDFDRRLVGMKSDLAGASTDVLRRNAEDRSASNNHRMLSAWLLAGTRRFHGTTMPTTLARPRTECMRMMAASRMPLMLYYIADRAASRLAEAMFVSNYLMAEFVANDPPCKLEQSPLPVSVMIDNFPSEAYDLHTREGLGALRRFRHECPDVKDITIRLSPKLRDKAVQFGVFIAEGGKLQNQLRFDQADTIESNAHRTELSYVGFISLEQQNSLLATINHNLALLNRARADRV